MSQSLNQATSSGLGSDNSPNTIQVMPALQTSQDLVSPDTNIAMAVITTVPWMMAVNWMLK